MTSMPPVSPDRLAVLAALAVGLAGCASDQDLHAFWDRRCYECHGHAGPFARQKLILKDGKLEGRRHIGDLRHFLAQHYMTEPMAGRVYDMLLAQAASEPVYQARCASCHKTAAELVRGDMDVESGALVARKSRQPLGQFLLRHGGDLSERELATVLKSLGRIHAEIQGQTISKPEVQK